MIQLVAQKTGGCIRKVCTVLGEARSSFYHASTPAATQVADVGLGDLIEAVFRRHRRRYGYRRLAEDLSDRGVTCAPARAERSETAAHSFLQIRSGNPPPRGPERSARNPAKKLRPENQRRQSRQALAQSPLRPAPACCSRPCLGWGHYLHPDERRMALPGRRHRSVLAPHRGLESRRPHAFRSRPRCAPATREAAPVSLLHPAPWTPRCVPCA